MLSVVLALCAALAGVNVATAQLEDENPADASSTPPPTRPRVVQFEQAPNRVRQQLGQLDALVAESQWAEAIELLQSLLADESAKTSVVEAAPDYFVSLAESCHTRIASLPPEALAQYRAIVDPAARRQFQAGVAARDEAALRRLLDESFCSSWGDDALLALSEIALERGDFSAARGWLRRIDPRVSDLAGRPLSWALRGVDLVQHGEAVADHLASGQRVGGWLVYPDAEASIADVLARLTTASIREGDLDRARVEIAWLEAVAPEAQGRLAGASRPLAGALRESLAAAQERFRTNDEMSPAVGPLVGRLWPSPYPLQQTPIGLARLGVFGRRLGVDASTRVVRPIVEPINWGRAAIFRDGSRLMALDLVSAEPAITKRGDLHRAVQNPTQSRGRVVIRGGLLAAPTVAPNPVPGLVEAPTIVGDRLYARVGPDATQASNPEKSGLRLIARDLARENLAVLELDPPEAPWSFGGPPLVRGDKLFIALSADDVRPRVSVACYSARTGRTSWQTPVASGPPPAISVGADTSTYRLAADGNAVYLNTGFGAIASLRQADGSTNWVLHTGAPTERSPTRQTVGDCIVHGDRVYAITPSDETEAMLVALDATTGRPLWNLDSAHEDADLLGVTGKTLVLGGAQLAGVDGDTGRLRYQFPDSPKAGLRGMGRGCLAGGEVFWPTRGRLFTLNAKTGAPTRESIDIADLGGTGANVTPASGCLIVAGAKAMTVLGPVDRQEATQQPLLSQLQ